jgi:NodT family efflux transporter outer membrane factor (OMF) lipoprotein
MLRSVVIAASALVVASCSVGPNFHRPTAPADAGYSPQPLPEATASAPVPAGETQKLIAGRDLPFEWWQLFHSQKLNSLIERSLRANPNVAAAQAALAQAHELVSAQRGYYYPQVDSTYQFERHKISGNLTNDQAPGVQGNGDNLLPPLQDPDNFPHTAPLFYNFHTAEVTVGFVPDVFGANRRQVESLQAQAEAQLFALEATYLTLASNVAAAAIQEASLRGQIEATRQIIDSETRSLQVLRDQLRAGLAMRIDVAAQEAALAQAQASLPPLQKQFEQTRDQLRALAGNLPNQDIAETFALEDLTLPGELPMSVPAKLIEQRPDVRAAQAQLHAANAQVGVAVAAMLPNFSITGSVGGNADQLPWIFRTGGSFWNVVSDATQPIFHGGTLLHQKRAANQAVKQAAAQYQSAVITAYQNVADCLHAVLADADALSADAEAERAAKVTLDLTRRQMDVGYVNYLTLLSSQVAYQQTVINRIQAQALRYSDTIALFQALGGGWWNRAKQS